jgi:hypothetical protein
MRADRDREYSNIPDRQFYKVLEYGKSCHGGNFTWSLPGTDGAPGAWHELDGKTELALCSVGFHLTDCPPKWMQNSPQKKSVYIVEFSGALDLYDASDSKIVVSRCRLVRLASEDELIAVGVFSSGAHELKAGLAIADGSSTVTAYDNSTVRAYGSSTVTAYDNSTVRAAGSSTVTAYDNSTVRAAGSSTVTAYGSSTVTADDNSTVRAAGSSTVTAYGSSTVTADGSSTVTAYGYSTVNQHQHASVNAFEFAAVIDRRGGGVPICRTAQTPTESK